MLELIRSRLVRLQFLHGQVLARAKNRCQCEEPGKKDRFEAMLLGMESRTAMAEDHAVKPDNAKVIILVTAREREREGSTT